MSVEGRGENEGKVNGNQVASDQKERRIEEGIIEEKKVISNQSAVVRKRRVASGK